MSGLIYVGIIALWAVVLSILVRRHDEASEAKSIDRFSTAMRLLSRRTVTEPGTPYAVRPPRPRGAVEGERPRDHTFVKGTATGARRAPDAGRPAARTRRGTMVRRRAFAAALLTLLTLSVLAALGVLPVWSLGAGVVLLLGYVVGVRAQARRDRRTRRAQDATSRSAEARRRRAERIERVRALRDQRAADLEEAAAAGCATAVAPGAGADAVSAGPDGLWEPRPWPLPTYVTAPVVHRAPSLDPAGDPVAQEEARRAEEGRAAREAALRREAQHSDVRLRDVLVSDEELDMIIDRPWAVND